MEWRHGITVLNSTALQQLFITFKWGWLYTKSILYPFVPIQTIQSLLPVSAQSNCAHDTYPIPWLPFAIPCFYQLLAQPNLHRAFVTLVQSQDRQTARVKAHAASGVGTGAPWPQSQQADCCSLLTALPWSELLRPTCITGKNLRANQLEIFKAWFLWTSRVGTAENGIYKTNTSCTKYELQAAVQQVQPH